MSSGRSTRPGPDLSIAIDTQRSHNLRRLNWQIREPVPGAIVVLAPVGQVERALRSPHETVLTGRVVAPPQHGAVAVCWYRNNDPSKPVRITHESLECMFWCPSPGVWRCQKKLGVQITASGASIQTPTNLSGIRPRTSPAATTRNSRTSYITLAPARPVTARTRVAPPRLQQSSQPQHISASKGDQWHCTGISIGMLPNTFRVAPCFRETLPKPHDKKNSAENQFTAQPVKVPTAPSLRVITYTSEYTGEPDTAQV